jgi:putative ABC transport system permease protein
MPPATRSANRAMFWRILRRFITGNPGRLTVMLLALGAGAVVTAALLNLQVDAQRRLTTEFTAFGANIIVAPRDNTSATPSQATLDQSILKQIPTSWDQHHIGVVAHLYLLANASVANSKTSLPVVVSGSSPFAFLAAGARSSSGAINTSNQASAAPGSVCVAGARVAQKLGVTQDADLLMTNGNQRASCRVRSFRETGGPADDQVEIFLPTAQQLAGLPGRISLVELTVPGTPQQITSYIADLQHRLPGADVRPIRQFTEGEARIYNRISGVLTATIALVLILTALCVMAAMTNVATERRNDVGLMKAIGGATRRVLRLFLVEAALLGLASGIVGGAVGIAISMWLGKAVFGLAARPRLIVYPVAVALTVIVAIAGAYPLRRLANIRPASVFRGEA